ncbi:FHA domain-containing protein [Microlunatus phosphovorus]|nr:FHA domain-containing protein [Microlunatus phosphovorus]
MSSKVADWRTSHVPGRWPVLMGPSSLVIVSPATDADLSALWEKVTGAASMAELVSALAVIGPDASPDLVAMFWSPSGMRSLVRGNVRLLDPGSAEVIADGAGMVTWREVGLADRTQIEIDLGAGPVGDRGLPLVIGAVRAGAVRIEAGAGAAVISPQATAIEQTIPPDQLGGWTDPDHSLLESSELDLVASGAMWPPTDWNPFASLSAEDDLESPVGPAFTRKTEPPTADVASTAVFKEDPGLFGERGVVEALAPAVPDEGAVLVQAALCLSGHPNPPYADRCPLCDSPVPPQSPQLVARPVLGILRSPDGTSVAIDRPILVGRAPVLRDDLPEAPSLMRVPSPGQDISRTHLLVSPDDWEIRLTDLHSTNGTTIVRPGAGTDRLKLRPGEPLAVLVGTLVELGDGVSVLVDGPPRPD